MSCFRWKTLVQIFTASQSVFQGKIYGNGIVIEIGQPETAKQKQTHLGASSLTFPGVRDEGGGRAFGLLDCQHCELTDNI